MCGHDKFDILLYEDGVMIRKCKECGEVEVRLEYWANIDTLREKLGSLVVGEGE